MIQMSNKAIAWVMLALIGLVFVCLFVYLSGPTSEEEPSVVESKDKAFDETKKGDLSEPGFPPTFCSVLSKRFSSSIRSSGMPVFNSPKSGSKSVTIM